MSAAAPSSNGRHPAVRSPEPPSVVVGYSMGNGPVPLGLDRPLDLLGGGERLAPNGMPMALGIDHVPGLREFIADACRSSSLAGGTFYAQPPLVLLGERGAGKGFAAQWIARHAGLPIFRMDGGSFRPGEGTDEWEERLPGLPVLAMASSRCANPIVAIELDQADMIDATAQRHLASMIDRRRNRRWVDEKHEAIFDLSHVSWIILIHGHTPSDGDRRPVSPAALPGVLRELLEEQGTTLRPTAQARLEHLRRLDVAIVVCHREGIRDPSVVASVHDAVEALRHPQGGRLLPMHAALVEEAQRALSILRSGPTGT